MNPNRHMLRYISWQVKLLARYHILSIALAIAAIYLATLFFFPVLQNDLATTLFVFIDPTAIGFLFIGVLILYEKGDNTLYAQVVTPMQTSHYIWAKAIALLIPAIICSTAIVAGTRQLAFRPVPFYISLSLSSLIFTFIGIAGVIRVNTFNQYIVFIPLFMIPASLPLLNFLGLTDWKMVKLIPTWSALNLFTASFSKPFTWAELVDMAYLGLWTYISYYFARLSFEKKMY